MWRDRPREAGQQGSRNVAQPAVAAGDENRARILRAAEELMAEEGIDGVSLREINKAAGQRNASAIQYHFGDRDGLLVALLARHQMVTDPRRHELLDAWEENAWKENAGKENDGRDVHALAAALVVPLVEKLKDPDGGRAYLQIAAEFYSRARTLDDLGDNADPNHSMARWHALVAQQFPEAAASRFPPQYAALRLVLGEVARRAQDPPRRSDKTFCASLTDLVAAILVVPPR